MSYLRNGSLLPKRSNSLSNLAEAEMWILNPYRGSTVPEEPHEIADGGLWKPRVFLTIRFDTPSGVHMAANPKRGVATAMGSATGVAVNVFAGSSEPMLHYALGVQDG